MVKPPPLTVGAMSEIGPTSTDQVAAPVAPVPAPVTAPPSPTVVLDRDRDQVELYVADPYWVTSCETGVDGVDAITRTGTAVPIALVDQVIAAGATVNTTIERR